MKIDKNALKQIEAVIREAEAKTAGEIRVCIARRSHRVPLLPLLAVAALAGIAGWFAAKWWAWGYPTLLDVALLVSGGLLLAVAVLWLLWPKRKDAVREHAMIEFQKMGIADTSGRTGVLLYLSQAERQAVILADRAIHGKVREGTWQKIIDEMIHGIRGKKAAEAISGAVREIGTHLASHFPRKPDDVNELPDKVETR